jgi:hypothetical protein
MRKHLKTQSDGITRVLQSAAALRRQHGLWGKAKDYAQAYAYLHKRTHWMRSRHYSRQHLPIGSGMTEVSRLQCPYTDSRLLSYYWPDGIMKPCRRCRQTPIEARRRERKCMPAPVLPPRF